MAQTLREKVKNYMSRQEMLCDNEPVVAGISGGADSVCLLDVLSKILDGKRGRILAVCVDHGLRQAAAGEAEYVRTLCEERSIPLRILRWDVAACASDRGITTEEAGRLIRYASFEACAKSPEGYPGGLNKVIEENLRPYLRTADAGKAFDKETSYKIAVAHNANDTAETVLFHLFRGTGIKGLTGIPAKRDNIIRPLLCCTREEIERYLAAEGIEFCTDESNLEDVYTRNRIRHHILRTATEEINEKAVEHIAQMSEQLVLAEGVLEELTKEDYEDCLVSNGSKEVLSQSLSAVKLKNLQPYRRQRVLRKAFEESAGTLKDLEYDHIMALERLTEGRDAKELSLPCGIKACLDGERLEFWKTEGSILEEKKRQSVPVDVPFTVGEEVLLNEAGWKVSSEWHERKKEEYISGEQYTKCLDYDKIKVGVRLRTALPGDWLVIDRKGKKQSLRRYLINEKVPVSERGRVLVLAKEDHVFWIVGYRIGEDVKITDTTEKVCTIRAEKAGK